jgi:hypothetical protein
MLKSLDSQSHSKVLHSTAIINLRRELEREGYAFGPGAVIRQALDFYEEDFDAIVEAGRVLPNDSYDPSGMRARALSQAILAPWANSLSWLPPHIDGRTDAVYTTYFQDLSSNPEIGGVERHFAPLPYELQRNRTLCALIQELWWVIPGWRAEGRGRAPVLVNVHLNKLQSDGRRAALPSPREIHVDGEPFTFVILVERTPNLVGGISYVADRCCAGKLVEDLHSSEVVAEGTLLKPLDMLAIDDGAISHTVSGVRTVDCHAGWRTVLFIDYSVLKPVRTCPP